MSKWKDWCLVYLTYSSCWLNPQLANGTMLQGFQISNILLFVFYRKRRRKRKKKRNVNIILCELKSRRFCWTYVCGLWHEFSTKHQSRQRISFILIRWCQYSPGEMKLTHSAKFYQGNCLSNTKQKTWFPSVERDSRLISSANLCTQNVFKVYTKEKYNAVKLLFPRPD